MFSPVLADNVHQYVMDCLDSGWISSRGPYVPRFERAFAEFCQAEHGISTTSGTTALHLVLAALGVGPGDEVLVPDLTFVATANAVRYCGATPVLVELDADTWTLSPSDARRKLSSRTRAVIPVHLYGQPADMDPIIEMARAHGCSVVEDAAQAHGAQYKDRPVGSLGDAGVFSFYGNKIFTTGEGGMIVTNDRRLAERARYLRDHAMDPGRHYTHSEIGFNYRMTNLQAAIGCAQLEQQGPILARCAAIAEAYERGLDGIEGVLARRPVPWTSAVCWVYSVLVTSALGGRDLVAAYLRARNIATRPFFVPLHELLPYRVPGGFPVSASLAGSGISLPSGPGLSDEKIETVCAAIRELAARGADLHSAAI